MILWQKLHENIQVSDVPGVIKILDWFEGPESFFIVMEKFAGQVGPLQPRYSLMLILPHFRTYLTT